MSASARYVAIITDGNGRWAQNQGLPVVEGHRAGARRPYPFDSSV